LKAFYNGAAKGGLTMPGLELSKLYPELITHDKDFGALAFRWELPVVSGVILFRLSGDNPDADNQRILDVLEEHVNWAGHFRVITDDRIRVRSLPRPK